MKKLFKQKKRVLVFLMAFFSVGVVSAQVSISGKLTDQKGAPLIAASVAELGTTNGAFTELDGTWTLTVKSADAVLEFSYVGFQTQTMKVGSKKTFNVALKPDAVQMETVVKIGYASAKKEDATGANKHIGGEELTNAPVLAVDQALQGKASGVSVTSNSGTPGAGMDIVIRGRGTTGEARPLYVVDGVAQGYEYKGDPGNIESLTILKDASSCAIYGARGANGVVLITTKGGNEVADYEYASITFDAYRGAQSAWKKMDVLDAEQYKTAMGTFPANYEGANTDWQDEVFQAATIEKYKVTAEGGSAKSSWSVSAGYQNQDGIVKTTNYNRYDFGVKSMYKINKRLDIGTNLGFNRNSQAFINENKIEQSVLGLALIFDPTIAADAEGADRQASGFSGQPYQNPIAKLEYEKHKRTGYGIGGGAWMNYKLDFLLDGLEFKSQFNYGMWENQTEDYTPAFFVSAGQKNDVPSIENMVQGGSNWSITNTLTYTLNLYDKIDTTKINHGIRLLLGHEAMDENQDTYRTRIENIGEDEDQHFIIAGDNGTSWAYEYDAPNAHSMISYIGRMEYAFKDKYLANVTLRRDGSSRFGTGRKYGFFPSFGLAWKINKEPFFYNNEFLRKNVNLLKLRGGWGKIGNEAIANYLYTASMTPDVESGYSYGGTTVQGVIPKGIANEEVHWEEARSWDIGADLAFWKNKFQFNFDYFVKHNTDNLVQIAVPDVVGTDKTNPTVNVGKILNRGYEMDLTYRNNFKFKEDSRYAFNYSIGGNFSHIYNEVQELGGSVLQGGNIGRSSDVYACRTLEGYSIATYWGYKVDGVFSSWSEINQSAQPSAKLGDFKIKDINGDGKINSDDITCIGNPNPDFTYGFNVDAAFAGVDFSMSFQGVAGNDIFNATRYYLDGGVLGANMSTRRLDAWSEENSASVEPTNVTEFETWMPSSAYVENGSYFRLKNLTLGYSLPTSVLEKVKLQKFRVYFQAQNLLTFTKYSGFDPEIGRNTAMDWEGPELGVDRGVYPQARTFVFGLNLGF